MQNRRLEDSAIFLLALLLTVAGTMLLTILIAIMLLVLGAIVLHPFDTLHALSTFAHS